MQAQEHIDRLLCTNAILRGLHQHRETRAIGSVIPFDQVIVRFAIQLPCFNRDISGDAVRCHADHCLVKVNCRAVLREEHGNSGMGCPHFLVNLQKKLGDARRFDHIPLNWALNWRNRSCLSPAGDRREATTARDRWEPKTVGDWRETKTARDRRKAKTARSCLILSTILVQWVIGYERVITCKWVILHRKAACLMIVQVCLFILTRNTENSSLAKRELNGLLPKIIHTESRARARPLRAWRGSIQHRGVHAMTWPARAPLNGPAPHAASSAAGG